MHGSSFFQTRKSVDSLNLFFSFFILIARGGLDFITRNPLLLLAMLCYGARAANEMPAAAVMPEVGSTQNTPTYTFLSPRDGLTSRMCLSYDPATKVFTGYDVANLNGDKSIDDSSIRIAIEACHVPHSKDMELVAIVNCFEYMLKNHPDSYAKLSWHNDDIVPLVSPVSSEECTADIAKNFNRR